MPKRDLYTEHTQGLLSRGLRDRIQGCDMASDPWAALERDWPWVKIYIRKLPDRFGQTVWSGAKPYIELAHDLGEIVQRVTLAHEMFHLIAGAPCVSFCDSNEREVRDQTARWLLPDLADVGRALGQNDITTAAATLGVTRDILSDRLTFLTPAEEREIAEFLETGADAGITAAHDRPRRLAGTPSHMCKLTKGKVVL